MILPSYAVIDPCAVMIKVYYAFIANVTMLASLNYKSFTIWTQAFGFVLRQKLCKAHFAKNF